VIAPKSLRAVIFDLDGTLVDSSSEIAVALGRTFQERKLPPLSRERVETLIGRGVVVLVERALAEVGAATADTAAVVERFETHYAQTVGTAAALFPGVAEGMQRFQAAGWPMAVVTNKPRYFTEHLLERLGVKPLLAAIVAGDDGIRRKPHGDMLVAACNAMDVLPEHTLMLGDSDNDIVAARAACCPVWCVPYGYNEGKPPEQLDCDRLVATIDEAARLLLSAAGSGFPSTRE
jgi:phosphoglycolate phosphatase